LLVFNLLYKCKINAKVLLTNMSEKLRQNKKKCLFIHEEVKINAK